MTAPRWLVRLLPLLVLTVAPVPVRADDPPQPAPATPAVAKDDLSEIQPEFKKTIKRKNDAQLAKDRAAYYETKNFKGSGLFYLGCIYEIAGDAPKTIETLEKFLKSGQGLDGNKEAAWMRIMAAHTKLKAYDKAIEAGEKVLAAYPMSNHSAQNLDDMGRIYRRWGKDELALKKFLEAAEAKSSAGVFDAIDLYLLNGQVDKAKELLTTCAETLKAATKGAQAEMASFLADVGKEAPALTGARSPTKTEVPAKFGGSWAVLYGYNLTISGLEKRMGAWHSIKNRWDKVEPWFVGNYIEWDPFEKKVVKGMTPDQEFDLQVKVMEKESGGGQALTVPNELFAQLHFKAPSTRVIIDPEGKFRWIRMPEQRGDYDVFVLQRALDKLTGQDHSAAGAEAGGDGGAEGGEKPAGGDAPGGGEAPGGDMPGGGDK